MSTATYTVLNTGPVLKIRRDHNVRYIKTPNVFQIVLIVDLEAKYEENIKILEIERNANVKTLCQLLLASNFTENC